MHEHERPLPHDGLVDGPTAAVILGRSEQAIWQYGHRGLRDPRTGERVYLRPAGLDGRRSGRRRGHNLYSLTDVSAIGDVLSAQTAAKTRQAA